MFKNLSPGAIGLRVPLEEAMVLARESGFEGLDVNIGAMADLADEKGLGYVQELWASSGLRPGGWGLPVPWSGPEEDFQAGLQRLPHLAAIGQALNCPWVTTWVLPFSNDRPFEENFEFHVRRFRPCAEILKDYGCRLGLEFIGPKTLRANARYEFIYTLDGMLELCAAIGTGNMGLLLDGWHWYTSGGTVEDLQRLTREDVVYVHINDAPAGIPRDEQIDNVRCLPGETGVIDNVSLLRCLREIGYEGPVTPEPFSQRVNALPPAEAARVTAQALNQVWAAAGLD